MTEWTKELHEAARNIANKIFSGPITRRCLRGALSEIERCHAEIERLNRQAAYPNAALMAVYYALRNTLDIIDWKPPQALDSIWRDQCESAVKQAEKALNLTE